MKNLKLAVRHTEQRTVINVSDVAVGRDLVVIAGPCSVESEEQMHASARAVKDAGADMLRGGAFKPRTSPYAFQGLGLRGLKLLAEAGRQTGLPIVTEVIDPRDVSWVAEFADGVVRLPTTHPLITPLLYILPGQLLPYYTEVARPGGNPDAQRTDQPRYARAFDIAMPPKSH